MTAGADAASQPVLIELLEGGVLTLTLNRPDRLNAFNIALHEALADAIRRASANDECRARAADRRRQGLLRRAGPIRSRDSAGRRPARPRRVDRQALQPPHPIRCAACRSRSSARSTAPRPGAGANVALACDIVLAAKSAKFLQAFARIGLVPDSGGTWFLPRLVGEARARALMMLADPIGAEEAEAWGMI